MAKAITPRAENYSQWYLDIVYKSGLADQSPVRGCMIIKPLGYALWEEIRRHLDAEFHRTGHVNAYFPLLIPKHFLSKEAEHVEGFAKECAVVTHHRLRVGEDGRGLVVDPEARLEEELIIRPTSETIIWDTFRQWIHSYRDLPLLINQWANVVRWELRTRPFLRTAEFLWQEGHTAHATAEEAIREAELIHDIYARFSEEVLAIPVVRGVKTESERFAGAEETYTIEAMMQDRKALQAGTSHFLGQNFAKAFEVTYLDESNTRQYVWATSWGVSTRLIGALVMTHSDDDGLILPPKIAPTQVIIIAVPKPSAELLQQADRIAAVLREADIRVEVDRDEKHRPGFKFAEYELRGVPVRIVIGPRDLEKGVVEITRRDTRQKEYVPIDQVAKYLPELLQHMQRALFERAAQFRQDNTFYLDRWEDFEALMRDQGGFVYAHWDGTAETEQRIQELTKATIRCIPADAPEENGKCILTGKPSSRRVLFAKAY